MNLAILQARCSSSRFPGKVIADLLGQPMIVQQIRQIAQSKLIDKLVVATSTHVSDDILVSTLEKHGVPYFRGSLDDVLSRYVEIIRLQNPEAVIRLTGDCPLIDPAVIDLVIREHKHHGADYTANTIEPTFPDGLDVECFNPSTLVELANNNPSPIEKEHVTYGMYTRPNFAKTFSVKQATDNSHLRWTVDVPEDLEFVASVYRILRDQNLAITQETVLGLLNEQPELSRTESDLARNISLITQEKETGKDGQDR